MRNLVNFQTELIQVGIQSFSSLKQVAIFRLKTSTVYLYPEGE